MEHEPMRKAWYVGSLIIVVALVTGFLFGKGWERTVQATETYEEGDPARKALVDLGGAETNSEMAVEMLAEERRGRVVVCNAPVVEGAVIAATESSGGSSLAAVKRSAEEFYA